MEELLTYFCINVCALLVQHHHIPAFKAWLQIRWRFTFSKESHGKDERPWVQILLLVTFQWDTRGKFLKRTISHCNHPPGKSVEFPNPGHF